MISFSIFIYYVHPINNVEYNVMVGDKQFIVKLNLGSCSCRVWDFHEIPCSHCSCCSSDVYPRYIFLCVWLLLRQDVVRVMARAIILGLANFVKLINDVIIIVAFYTVSPNGFMLEFMSVIFSNSLYQ